MTFHFAILGYGLTFAIGTFDPCFGQRTILAWSIIRRYVVWRGENHSRTDYGYNYRCIKNGKDVENISFRSPVVNNAR